MSKIDLNKIERLKIVAQQGIVALVRYIFDIEDKINSEILPAIKAVEVKVNERLTSEIDAVEKITKNLFKDMKGMKGDVPVAGVDYPIPENGKDYVLTVQDKQEIADRVTVPVVEKIIERTEVIKEVPMVTEITNEIIKEVALLQTGEDIVNKINNLSTDDDSNKIDKEHIKGWKEEIETLRKEITESKTARTSTFSGGRNVVQVADLTAQCNGVTKTFEVPSHRFLVSLQGTQFPIVYRPTIDFTIANKILTLTDQVSAPDTGQTLIFLYIK